MVTGARAYDRGPVAALARAVDDTPAPPRQLNPAVPRALERVIRRLLARDVTARYQSAAAVRADLLRLSRGAAPNDSGAPASNGHRLARVLAAIAVTMLAAVAVWVRPPFSTRVPPRGEYAQMTYFSDSATSPALSADGRLLTFIRGESTFFGPGQVYLKALPDGNPVQLTFDRTDKMSPVFSPDGSRIAYTTVTNGFVWDTWVVPVAGGPPQPWFANTSGLTWIANRRLLFSEITHGMHMQVVSADDTRGAIRSVYTPDGSQGMAHRSVVSPDGRSAVIAEMVRPQWQRCRLVALAGGVQRAVGPDGQCTSAAWSPDGRWMYFASNSTGTFHIWRQQFPDGTPEQVTVGPTEEEGIAASPDGRSLLTSVGIRQSSVWIRDGRGEREVSTDGYAFVPAIPNASTVQPFASDGRSLLYLARRGPVRFAGPGERAGELWQTDLDTGQSHALFPGQAISSFAVSRDRAQVLFAALDGGGTPHIWLGRLDGAVPPRQLSPLDADSPHFGANGSVYFRGATTGASFIYRMNADGGVEQATPRPVVFFLSVSPDYAWLVARVDVAAGPNGGHENVAFPTAPGGSPVTLCASAVCEVDWTPNGTSLVVRIGGPDGTPGARTFVVALGPGEALPRLPSYGIRSERDLAGRVSQAFDGFVYPADSGSAVAFVRSRTERNIYRVPLP